MIRKGKKKWYKKFNFRCNKYEEMNYWKLMAYIRWYIYIKYNLKYKIFCIKSKIIFHIFFQYYFLTFEFLQKEENNC